MNQPLRAPHAARADDHQIRARNLTKTYPNGTLALSNVSFDVGASEFISLVGPSGCGKSTLLKIVGGLLPYTGGSAEIDGRAITGPGPEIGMVFQAPVLLPWLTILDNVLFPVVAQSLPKGRFEARARDLLAMVGLAGFEGRYPHELSGGMQQRAAIVRALVQDPPILLMDEPFGALDAMTRDQMNLELRRIWAASGKTILFVTHSITEAVYLSDRVFVMTPRPGKLEAALEIDLPRERTLSIVNTPEFGAYAERIRQLLNVEGGIAE